MKNTFKTGLYVMAFALAGIFFQISCSNSDDSAVVNNEQSLTSSEKFVFVKKDFPTTNDQSIWIANFDGSDLTQIPVALPSGLKLYTIYSSGEHSTVKLSKDDLTVLFTVQNGSGKTFIYSCNIDGSNLQEVAEFDQNIGVFL